MTSLHDIALRANHKGRPKGLVDYRPQKRSLVDVERILDVYAENRDADALPTGPRTVGYRLKELYPGEYTKADFPSIGTKITRLQQAGKLPWEWVSDASSVEFTADGYAGPEEFEEAAPGLYNRDRRAGQDTVVEVYAEAKETLPLIRRLAVERGVAVYSGSGSSGPGLARKVAARALLRAVEHGQSTVLLGICDFDQAGIGNVLRPHLEHVAAFLYGSTKGRGVLAMEGQQYRHTEATFTFHHLGLTPEHARTLVTDPADRHAIDRYLDSGTDLWTRNLDLLNHVQKIETEAVHSIELRRLVIEAIETHIDTHTLAAITQAEATERAEFARRLQHPA